MATKSKTTSKRKHWKWIVPLSLVVLITVSVWLTLLVLFRYHFSSQDYPRLAHWVGNDLLKLDEEEPRPQIAGHRGAAIPAMSDGIPLGEDGGILVEGEKPLLIGNTASAIQRAISAGVDWIEIDIRATKDGDLVVFHDKDIDLKTTGKGKVEDLTLIQLGSVDYLVEPPEKILSLDQVFEQFHQADRKWIFDVKATGISDLVNEWIGNRVSEGQLRSDQVVIFGRRKVLKEFAGSPYDLGYTVTWGAAEGYRNRLRVLFSPLSVAERAEDLGCRYLVLPIIFSDQVAVDAALAKGIEVWIYGTEERLDHEHAAGRGISGLIVDDPEQAMEGFVDHPEPGTEPESDDDR